MSIDNRVVHMQFDNDQFEKGIKTSVKSIDDLKKSLNLDGASASLSNLNNVGNRFSLAHISNGVDTIAGKFTALGIIGMTVLQNITNSAINAGKNLISSLTVDPIMDGFGEYELKMNAIQTILTNTANKGTKLDDVNKALDELNEYADQTIYNFAEMTDNVGKFTAAGLGLKDSVTTVKGLANVAAGFGVDATKMAGATYQMSQALSAGVVKLQDWKSMEQASMGGQMIQDQLRATAKEMGIYVDASIPFRESLEKGWLTSAVFVKAMEKMAKDKSLLEAATNVTTFTKLMSTMKEAVGSGWATTWERIIGNKDESTKFFTAISNGFGAIIGKSADARNSMLAFWSANGGRKDLILGIANAFKALGALLAPIEDAFSKVFPAVTAQNLLDISKAFKELMGWFIIGEGTSDKLRRTFQGLFSVIDIVRMVIVTLAEGVAQLLGISTPLGTVFLAITASIGDFLTGVNNIFKMFGMFDPKSIIAISDLFVSSFSASLSSGLSKASQTLKNFITLLQSSSYEIVAQISSKFNVVSDALDRLAEGFNGVKNKVYGFSKIFESARQPTQAYAQGVQQAADSNVKMEESISGFDLFVASIVNGFKRLIEYIKPLTSSMGVMFTNLRDELARSLKDITFEEVVSAIQTFITGSLVLSLRKLANVLSKGLPKVLEGAANTLDAVRSSLETWQNNVKSKMIMNIAIALGILTVAIYALSQIDGKKLAIALGALTAMLTQLMGGFYAFSKIIDGKQFASMAPLAVGMIALSISVAILANAMSKLVVLDWPGVIKGLTVVTVLLAEMIVVANVLSNQVIQLTGASIAMIGIAGAISILINAVATAGLIPYEQLKTGLISVALALGAIAALAKITANTDLLTTAAGIAVIAVGLHVLTAAIAILGNMNQQTIGQGLLVIGIALMQLALAMAVLPPNLGSSALGVLAVAVALNVMASAVAIFGNMNFETIKQGILSLASVLTVLVIAMNLLKGTITSAVAVGIIAGALHLLIVPISILGNMPIKVLATGILAMAAALLVLGGTAYILAPVAPAMLSIASAVGILGLGLGVIALAVGVFAAGLTMLVGAVAAVLAALPMIGEVIRGLIKEFNKVIPLIGDTLGLILQLIINLMPRIKLLVQKILDMVLELIVEYAPKIVDAFIRLLVAIVGVISERTKPISDAGAKVIISIIDTISGLYNRFVEAGSNIINGLIKGVTNKITDVAKAGKDLGNSILNSAKSALGIHSPSRLFTAIGENLANAMTGGLKEESAKPVEAAAKMSTNVGKAAGAGIGKAAGNAAKEASKSAFDISMEWIEKQKYFKLMSIEEEKAAYEKMLKQYAVGSKEREKIERELFRVKNEIEKATYQNSINWIDDRKYYNQLSLKEELEAWERVQAKYKEGTEERKKADREVYRVKQALNKEEEDYWNSIIQESKERNEKKYKEDYDNAVSAIDDKKYYNQLSLNDELAALEEMQSKYSENSEERKKIDREVYRVKNEIANVDKEYSKQVLDVQTEANEKRKKLEDDYYAKTQEINDKLKQDVQSITYEYTKAVDARSNALYGSFGLFDKVEKKDPVSGSDLINNLRDQVNEFETWQQTLNQLSSKGVDTGLIKELQDMGPKSLAEIKALNSMSSSELEGYVSMWRTKHSDARTQALGELEGMRKDAISKIEELTKEADSKLKEYNATWADDMEKLKTDTDTQLETLRVNWMAKIGTLRSDTEKEMDTMSRNIQNTIKSPDWSGLGANIVNGIKQGVQSKAQELAWETARAAYQALQAAKDELGIHSPSRAFAEVGRYSMEGFIVGIKNYTGNVMTAISDVGVNAIDSLRGAISKISDAMDGNMELAPVIRPVLDLTNIEAGGQQINDMLSQRQGINVGSIASKVPNVATTNPGGVNASQNGSSSQSTSVQFVQNNYSPKPLSRIDIYRQTKNQISVMKGLVTST